MEWHMGHVTSYVHTRSAMNNGGRKSEISSMYRAYLCMKDQKELEACKPITSPHGYDLGVPYQVYNLGEQKIEQLVGDFMGRPTKSKAYVLNKEAQSRKLDAKSDYLAEEFFREYNKNLQKDTGLEIGTEKPEIELPEDVEEFFSKTYKDPAEETADDITQKFLEVDKNAQIIPEVLTDFLISDQCHLKIYNDNGTVRWRKGHPLEVDCDSNPHKVVQNNHQYYIEIHYLAKNDIFNDFELTKSERDQIDIDFAMLSKSSNNDINSGWYTYVDNIFRLAVVEMVWKSRKNIRGKETPQLDGSSKYRRIGEKDRIRKGETEKITSIEQPRHILMAGPRVVLSWGLEEHRLYKVANKKECFLNVISLYRQNTIGADHIRSVMAKLMKLQDWASEQLYEIRLAFRRNQGKVMVYDTAQTPRQYLKNNSHKNALGRMMHHAKKDGFVFINSKDKNNRYAFNQFSSVDFTTRNMIQDMMNGLALIEDLADKIIGLNDGRQGNSGQYSTATNVDSQRKASFSKTEIYYKPFDNFLQAALERMNDFAKNVYKEGDHIQYAFGDLRTKFIKITPEFANSDIGMYFNDGSKDARKKEIIDRAAELTLGNAQTEDMILALINVLSEDTAVESKAVLERAITASRKMREENEQAMNEQQQAMEQAKQQSVAEGNDLTKRSQDKDIVVADIYAKQKEKQIAEQTGSAEMIKLAELESKNIEKLNEANP